MPVTNKLVQKKILAVLGLFLVAALTDILLGQINPAFATISAMIATALLINWERSLTRRILKHSTIYCLGAVTLLLIIWILARYYMRIVSDGTAIYSNQINRSTLNLLFLVLLAGVVYLTARCANAASRRMAVIPLAVVILGYVLCSLVSGGNLIALDVTGLFIFTYVITTEACIQIGLIPTNTNYDKFFYSANIPAIITDIDGEVKYMTEASHGFDFDFPSRHQDVHTTPIKGGNVIWAQDLTELRELNDKLEEIKSRLSEENSLLRAENAMINRNARIESQTQIYEELSKIIQPSLQNIIFEIQVAESSESKEPLAMACVYTSYVKRRSNLMLIQADDNKIHSSELGNCLNETIDSLKLLGIGVTISGRFDGNSQRSELIKAYDAFQHIIEMNIDSMEYMLVYLSTEFNLHKITIMVSGDGVTNRTPLRNDYIYYFDEDEDTHYFNISFIKERD